MPDSLSDKQRQEILDAIVSGRKIEAIKLYREASWLGLAESKNFVDQLEAQLRKENPEAFAHQPKAGCGTTVLFIGIVILWAVSMFS